MSRFDNLSRNLSRFSPRRAVESLLMPDEPEPATFTRSSTSTVSIEKSINRPEDAIEEYYRLYETNPLIGQSIDNVASEVIEPGWFIEADSEATIDELTEYMENVAIIGGEIRQNFSELAYLAIVQYMVRGTFLAEKVANDNDNPVALNPLQVETFEVYTKPGSNILLAPDDTSVDGVKKTKSGDVAAYVQFDQNSKRWKDRAEKRFTRDQIIKWARDPDVGDVFGTSRVESVYERALALESKLRDNDDAIAMKAWPLILFQMGSEDSPWSKDEMVDFMGDFDAENFGPGMMKAVAGDVSIEEFAGETADIEHAVDTDVNFVVTGMPGPKYSLGGFTDQIGTTVASAQERQFRKLVRQLRRDLESKFTPYLVEVAEAYNLGTEGISLTIGRPQGDVNPEDISGSIIRYTSDVADPENPEMPPEGEGEGDGDSRKYRNTNPADQPAVPDMTSLDGGSFSVDASVEELFLPEESATDELADSRFVASQDESRAIGKAIEQALIETREQAIESLLERASNGQPVGPSVLDRAVDRAADRALRSTQFNDIAEAEARSLVKDTLSTMTQRSHAPKIDVIFGSRHASVAEEMSMNLVRDVRDAVSDMNRDMRHQLEASSSDVNPVEEWAQRARSQLSDARIKQRAHLMGHMRTQRVINSVKIDEYQRADNVAGVRVINLCNDNTTRLCEHLAGCGGHDGATAYFESTRSIGQQLSDAVSTDMLFDGFAPLPSHPPFHFGCRSELVPIPAQE